MSHVHDVAPIYVITVGLSNYNLNAKGKCPYQWESPMATAVI